MPRNGSGTYTLPAGNPVVAGTAIEATWANTTLNDVATEMTGSLSRAGSGGMTGPLRLDAGTAAVPALAWSTETTTGLYRAGTNDVRLAVATSDVMRWQAAGVSVTGTLGVSAAVTLSTTLAVTGTTTLTGAATLTANPTLSAGTANGVLFLDGSKVASSGSALTFDGTTLSVGGNLAITGTSRLITGDFSNATLANRTMVQTSTTNGGTAFGILPNGTSQTASIVLEQDSALGPNSPIASFQISASVVALNSVARGAGTPLPMTFTVGSERMRLDTSGNLGIGRSPAYKLDAYLSGTGSPAIASSNDNIVTILQSSGSSQGNVGTITSHPLVFLAGNTERMRLDTSGNLGLNTTTFGTSAAGVLSLGTGTAPTSGPADTVQLFSVDRSAGNTIPAIYCEGSGVTNAGITSTTVTHKIAMQVNGTIYYLLATTNAT